jgi:hypothetical protein
MKTFLLIAFTFISLQSFAISEKEISNMIVSMSDFSEKEKLTEKDYPELIRQLQNIIVLEKHDDSHEGPFELTTSYPQNKALYQRAIKSFKQDDQKVLQAILKIVENIAKNGNG